MSKIFCGSGKTVGKYEQINISLCLSDIPKEHISDYNGKKYINLTLSKRKEVDKYGKTHSLEINTWKPEQKTEQNDPWA